MALVMVRFEDGPLRGVTLPVDHTADKYRHTVRESIRGGAVRIVIYVYRRTGRTTFGLEREEDGGIE